MRRFIFPTLFPTDLVRPSAAGMMLLFAAGGASAAATQARVVPFEVHCVVTDPDNRPLEGVEVRLVLDAGPVAYEAGRGVAFRTDAKGTHMARLTGELRPNSIKRPTNFVDSLFSRKEPTDDLQLAAELEYIGTKFLYVVTLHRFREEVAVLYGKMSAFTRDERGNFTREVVRDKEGNWHFPSLGGRVVNDPGHSLAGAMFSPDETDPTGARWILKCQFKRSPAPVWR